MDKEAILKREAELLDALKITAKLSVEDAVNMLGISESTARRMFVRLEEKGRVIRVYGGISLLGQNDNSYVYERFENRNVDEKARIGKAAADIVEDDDVIFLDTGTTLSHMCIFLAKRIEAGELNSVRIFTSSLVNLNILQNVSPIILIGGEYRPNRRDFHGYIAEESIKKLNFVKCFLGADGFDISAGLTTTDFTTARMNQLALEHSRHSYILCDSSKCGRISSVTYSDITHIGCMITDYMAPAMTEKLKGLGVKIITA